jgi:hypothetical protein
MVARRDHARGHAWTVAATESFSVRLSTAKVTTTLSAARAWRPATAHGRHRQTARCDVARHRNSSEPTFVGSGLFSWCGCCAGERPCSTAVEQRNGLVKLPVAGLGAVVEGADGGAGLSDVVATQGIRGHVEPRDFRTPAPGFGAQATTFHDCTMRFTVSGCGSLGVCVRGRGRELLPIWPTKQIAARENFQQPDQVF